MSIENTNDVTNTDSDLDSFSAEFFGQNQPEQEPASSEEETNEVEDDGAGEADEAPALTDTTDGDDDTPANEDDSDEGESEEPEGSEDPKPKKNRFQERIDELTSARREAERENKALREEFENLKKQLEQNKEPTPTKEVSEGPQPSDLNEDGTEKYPLGEFDPQYIRDLTKFALEQERIALREREQFEAEQRKADEARAALQASWQEKLGPAQERYPDFMDKGQQLVDSFSDLDPAYSEYLTNTLMSMEYGPDVLYYLSNNPDEARKIVNSGAINATVSLGRIEAKFAFAQEEKQKARPRVSQAPTPPTHVNKGSAVATIDIPVDTDDLEAFEKVFLKKKK